MHTVIACEVFKAEMNLLREQVHPSPQILYLEQGLHDRPNELRQRVQLAIDELEAHADSVPERIVLGYGLCGRGLAGVSGKKTSLVIPKVHDCIPLLLGVQQSEADSLSQSGSTFWLSPGWLGCSQVRFVRERKMRFEAYREQFGEDSATYLMEVEASWLTHYSRACSIIWPELEGDVYGLGRMVAKDAGLSYTEQRGHCGYLKQLLQGGEDPSLFLYLAPGETVDIDGTGALCVQRAERIEPAV